MFSSTISLKPFLHSLLIDHHLQSTIGTVKWESLVFNKSSNFTTNSVLFAKGFKLNCLLGREMDIGTSSLVDGAAELLNEEVLVEEEVREPDISTMVLNFENKFDPYGAVSTPLYQTATFKQPSAIENGPYDYTRSGNPTRDALESLLAKLDKADRALCFTSGMSALSAVSHLVSNGEEIVAGDDLYGGSDRLLSQVLPKSGVVVKRVNTSDLNEVASAIGPQTKLVWLESPTNPRLQISDIRKIAELAHAHGALVLVFLVIRLLKVIYVRNNYQ
ncbi:PREDICTED: cystathionine beta-lyase, chloroplastic-like [Lupinus angustifolius]|uniref:cystathionine beta-lyase, chloroplastic-like n=1 Tax=Lupinus angustifolius TaxID=3871 RepID=UPI00092E9243|nr:PREDICTED: cystathionine beta-lyase, chloroplastic-like [Lupinus angustifolius]